MKTASLVFDGDESRSPNIPAAMGYPSHGQMQGTPHEQLIELCGRVCYDSLGSGRWSFTRSCPDCAAAAAGVDPTGTVRQGTVGAAMALRVLTPEGEAVRNPSLPDCKTCGNKLLIEGYHEHLLSVRHFSVHEHAHFTVEADLPPTVFLNMPDVYVRRGTRLITRATFNLRHVLELPNSISTDIASRGEMDYWISVMVKAAKEYVPHILIGNPDSGDEPRVKHYVVPGNDPSRNARESFVTMYMADSRVWSHEQVRHRCNISQRSGRYCDESNAELHVHPLMREFLFNRSNSTRGPIQDRAHRLGREIIHFEHVSRALYQDAVEALSEYAVTALGMGKTDARKQARSAARYYLGNGISTAMMFTASVDAWSGIFKQRISQGADAAIRGLMENAKNVIHMSRLGHLLA